MEKIDKVEEEIVKLRDEKAPCSKATLLGVCRGLGTCPADEDFLTSACITLRGGIGGTRDEGTCGALTAGAIALGLLNKDNPAKALRLTRELFEDFKKNYGTVQCGKIKGEYGTTHCTGCCVFAGRKVANLINENYPEKK